MTTKQVDDPNTNTNNVAHRGGPFAQKRRGRRPRAEQRERNADLVQFAREYDRAVSSAERRAVANRFGFREMRDAYRTIRHARQLRDRADRPTDIKSERRFPGLSSDAVIKARVRLLQGVPLESLANEARVSVATLAAAVGQEVLDRAARVQAPETHVRRTDNPSYESGWRTATELVAGRKTLQDAGGVEDLVTTIQERFGLGRSTAFVMLGALDTVNSLSQQTGAAAQDLWRELGPYRLEIMSDPDVGIRTLLLDRSRASSPKDDL